MDAPSERRATPSRTPAPDAPDCRCRECGHRMSALWQPGFGCTDAPGYWLVTCEHLGCDLWGQTFDHARYADPERCSDADLEPYRAYGRAHRAERAARRLAALWQQRGTTPD